ncbi:uncharacterized protein PAC_10175 [Phialocephala subalpina]|uniref:Methyltransferase small domain-containing protein n=1 Tax=Phialocephala subalpina TaxID=576137 RepID=A0A1L7X5I8_9HELO|nr:uncharacterized protein PAC_10175 [Phialocephala subalpina]
MPRLPNALILKGYKISPLLPLILRGARTLDSAINELRWLKEHVSATAKPSLSPQSKRKCLLQLCIRRSRAEPLQYILGSQPFGDLDIKCRPGILIPRPETEAYTTHLANLLLSGNYDTLLRTTGKLAKKKHRLPKVPSPRILDVCSGSGCISLLLHSLLATRFPDTAIFGLDISHTAIALSNQNLELNVKAGKLLPSASQGRDGGYPQVQFGRCNVLSKYPIGFGHLDIIISNPPYISKAKFASETTRSVRNYEPKLALVPFQNQPFTRGGLEWEPELKFYDRLLKLHQTHSSKILLMEIGDEEQARRVVEMAALANQHTGSNKIELWRDYPDASPEKGEPTMMNIQGSFKELPYPNVEGKTKIEREQIHRTWNGMKPENPGIKFDEFDVPIRGAGKIRSVVLFRENNFRKTEGSKLMKEMLAMRLEDVTLCGAAKKKWQKWDVGMPGRENRKFSTKLKVEKRKRRKKKLRPASF